MPAPQVPIMKLSFCSVSLSLIIARNKTKEEILSAIECNTKGRKKVDGEA